MQDSPLAILQAANLFVYCMNNPVRYTDPSGLSALDRTTQALVNRFVLTEYGRGPLNVSRINPQNAPITITQRGNNVNITAFVEISGGSNTIGNTAATNLEVASRGLSTQPVQTHREAVVHGLENLWARYRGGLNVNVTIIERGNSAVAYSPGQAFLSITIVDGGGISNVSREGAWSIINPGTMTLFTYHGGGGGERTFEQAAWTAAHELAHAMGVGDGWGYGYTRDSLNGRRIVESIHQYGDIISIMTQPGDPVTRFDVEMALSAHRYNEWQDWNNNPLLPRGIRR